MSFEHVLFFALAAGASPATAAISVYSITVTSPREAISVRIAATKGLITAFQELDPILDRLDGLVEIKKSSNNAFYNTYKAARVIVDTSGTGGGEPPPTN